MTKLIVQGDDLATVKNVIRAMGKYKVTELISDDDPRLAEKTVIKGTCSDCHYFTEIEDSKVKWGKCSKYGDSAISRTHKWCLSYLAEQSVQYQDGQLLSEV